MDKYINLFIYTSVYQTVAGRVPTGESCGGLVKNGDSRAQSLYEKFGDNTQNFVCLIKSPSCISTAPLPYFYVFHVY